MKNGPNFSPGGALMPAGLSMCIDLDLTGAGRDLEVSASPPTDVDGHVAHTFS